MSVINCIMPQNVPYRRLFRYRPHAIKKIVKTFKLIQCYIKLDSACLPPLVILSCTSYTECFSFSKLVSL